MSSPSNQIVGSWPTLPWSCQSHGGRGGGGGRAAAGDAGILEPQDTPLGGPVHYHQFRRARDERLQVFPPPEVRHKAGLGLARHQPPDHAPERDQPPSLQLGVELLLAHASSFRPSPCPTRMPLTSSPLPTGGREGEGGGGGGGGGVLG